MVFRNSNKLKNILKYILKKILVTWIANNRSATMCRHWEKTEKFVSIKLQNVKKVKIRLWMKFNLDVIFLYKMEVFLFERKGKFPIFLNVFLFKLQLLSKIYKTVFYNIINSFICY